MRAFVQTPGRAFAKDHSLCRTTTPLLAPRWSHAGPLQTTNTPSFGGAAAQEDSSTEPPGGPAVAVEDGPFVQGPGAGGCAAAAAATTLAEAARNGSDRGEDVSVAEEQLRGRGGEAADGHLADVQAGAVGDGTGTAARGLGPAADEGLTAAAAPTTATPAAAGEQGAALSTPPPPPPCGGSLPPLFVPVVLCMSEVSRGEIRRSPYGPCGHRWAPAAAGGHEPPYTTRKGPVRNGVHDRAPNPPLQLGTVRPIGAVKLILTQFRFSYGRRTMR